MVEILVSDNIALASNSLADLRERFKIEHAAVASSLRASLIHRAGGPILGKPAWANTRATVP
jgi:hypothetical protein